jgi:hypothetical protein
MRLVVGSQQSRRTGYFYPQTFWTNPFAMRQQHLPGLSKLRVAVEPSPRVAVSGLPCTRGNQGQRMKVHFRVKEPPGNDTGRKGARTCLGNVSIK